MTEPASGGATGGQMWMTGTYDPELNLMFVGTGNPTPVLNGAGAARRQPVDLLDRRAQSRHRQARVGVSGVAARHARLGRRRGARAGGRHVQRRAAEDAAAGVEKRLLLRAGSHHRQEPADHALRHRQLGERDRQGRQARSRTRRRSRRAMGGWWRRTKPAQRTTDRQASIRRPACCSSARRMRTGSTSSSPITARTAGQAPTTASGEERHCAPSTIQTGKVRWSHDLGDGAAGAAAS